MIWFVFAFLTAIAVSIGSVIEKKALIKEHAMEFSAVLGLFVLILSLPLFFFIDYSVLEFLPVFILFFASIIGAVAFLLVAKGVRHMEISDASPLMSLGTAVIAIFAFIFLRESLTFNQGVGIGLLIFGAYTLELKPHHNLLEPLKVFKKSKYIHYLLLALLLYGVTSLFDRILLFRMDMQTIAWVAFANTFTALHFFVMLHFFHDGMKGLKHGIKNAGWWIFLMAIFVVGARLAFAEAVKVAFIGLVSAVKRTSVLFSTLIGGELFHEKNIARKLVAALIMIGGAVLVVI